MDYNKKLYKQTIEKMTLPDSEKEKAKRLFHEANRKRKPRTLIRFVKPSLAVAAACAIILAGNNVIPNLSRITNTASEAETSENSCTLTVYAQELSKDGKVYLEDMDGLGSSLVWSDNKLQKLDYTFDFPVICKGQNIDTVTYSIDGSAFFQITCPEGKSIVKEGIEKEVPEEVDKQAKRISFYPTVSRWELHPKPIEVHRYQSFTLSYRHQDREYDAIQVQEFYDMWDEKKQKDYSELGYRLYPTGDAKLWDFLTRDLVITCTISYHDGSTEQKEICMGFDQEEEDGESWTTRYFYLK